MRDFSTLDIEHMMIHQVDIPKPNEDSGKLFLTSAECEFDDKIETFVKNKLISTIGTNRAFDVIIDENKDSDVPKYIKDLLKEDSSIIDISQNITKSLEAKQNRTNSNGFLIVIKGKIESLPIIGVFKTEIEEGVVLNLTTLDDGSKTYDVKTVENLILTKNTKFFKISVFYQPDSSKEDIIGRVSDTQLNSVNNVANFFMKFLGCTFKENPALKTKDFFEGVNSFIKQKIQDKKRQIEYLAHLNSYMKNQESLISSDTFAKLYIREEDYHPYLDFMEQNGLNTDFVKDISKIENRISQMKVTFENGIELKGSRALFEEEKGEIKAENEGIKFEKLEKGKYKVTFISRIMDIR